MDHATKRKSHNTGHPDGPTDIFGRINGDGDVDVLDYDSGEAITRLPDARGYPVGSGLGCGYDHPEGITLSRTDADRIGIEIEGVDLAGRIPQAWLHDCRANLTGTMIERNETIRGWFVAIFNYGVDIDVDRCVWVSADDGTWLTQAEIDDALRKIDAGV